MERSCQACLRISCNALDKAGVFKNILESSWMSCRVVQSIEFSCRKSLFLRFRGSQTDQNRSQEASWTHLGLMGSLERSWRPLGALLEGAPERLLARCVSHLGGQMALRTEPGKVPNRVLEATPLENCETLIFDGCTEDLLAFDVPGSHLGAKSGSKNGIQIASSTRKPSESLLKAS